MKYHSIDSQLFIANRKKFVQHMLPNAVAVFNSNDIYPVSADATMPFQQHRDIFYLTGADQEESVLVLFPNASNPAHREILFLRETNDHIAVWEGAKLTKEQATTVSGIKTVMWIQQFPVTFKQLMAEATGIYLNTNEHLRADTTVQTREDRFIIDVKQNYPAHQVHKSAPIMHRIRSVKESIELELMQNACNITEKGFRRLLGFVKPGVWEYEIEAELSHEFLCNRSKGFAYTPIIASGKNACVLHYIENNLLGLKLIDNTDIKNQDPNWPAYKKYFMHGTSHFLGLDTHDVGLWHEPIKAGMVFTCEPGIYIPEEGLGIRLEDDVVVQESGAPFNLMGNIPIEADEIETLMNA